MAWPALAFFFAEKEWKEGCGIFGRERKKGRLWHVMVGGKGGYNSTGAREAVGREGYEGKGREGKGRGLAAMYIAR